MSRGACDRRPLRAHSPGLHVFAFAQIRHVLVVCGQKQYSRAMSGTSRTIFVGADVIDWGATALMSALGR